MQLFKQTPFLGNRKTGDTW